MFYHRETEKAEKSEQRVFIRIKLIRRIKRIKALHTKPTSVTKLLPCQFGVQSP